jgi:hypothetical protein
MRETPYTIKEAADVLQVSDKTIRRMIDRGELAEECRDEQGRILISAASIAALRQVSNVSSHESRQPVEVFLPTIAAQDTATRSTVQQLAQVLVEQSRLIAELGERAGRAEERAAQLEHQLEQARTELSRQESRQVSNDAPEQPAPDAEPTPQAADQPAKRVPWWRKWFADI